MAKDIYRKALARKDELCAPYADVININEDTIMLQTYPGPKEFETDESSLEEIAWIKAFILRLNRQQLYNKGEDSKGESLGEYSPFTIEEKESSEIIISVTLPS